MIIKKKVRQTEKKMPHGCRRHETSSSSCSSSSDEHHKKRRKHKKRHHKKKCCASSSSSSSSSSEVRALPCEVVQCGRVVATLDFSVNITNSASPSGFHPHSCEPYFLYDGFVGADLTTAQYQANFPPGTEEDIITGKGFPFEQVVPVDTNCATITYHIENCALPKCESYVFTIARIDQCGKGYCGIPGQSGQIRPNAFSITPLATIPIDTAKGQDLCGRDSAIFAKNTGVKTVVCPLRQGDLVGVYLTILAPVNPCESPCVACVADEAPDPVDYQGPGATMVSIIFS
jgi:hypothetical protein